MDDLLLTEEAETIRAGEIKKGETNGVIACAKYSECESKIEKEDDFETKKEIVRRNMEQRMFSSINMGKLEEELDRVVGGVTSKTTSDMIKQCLPNGQYKLFPFNSFSLMVLSGAKGSLVNHSQVSCALGQQSLEGRRVPRMSSGKTLPSFLPYDPSIRAGN